MQFDLRERRDRNLKDLFSRADFARVKGAEAAVPMMLALAGNEGGNPRDSNAFLKIIRANTQIEDINVLGMTYPYQSSQRMLTLMAEFNSADIEELKETTLHRSTGAFVEKNLTHLFMKTGTAGEKEFFPLAELQQRFRAVNITGFCFGANVAAGICNNLGQMMEEYGYSNSEAKSAVSNVAIITIGCYTNYDRFLYTPRCIHIINPADQEIYSKSNNLAVISAKLGLEDDEYLIENNGGLEGLSAQLAGKIRPGKPCAVVEVAENQTVIMMARDLDKSLGSTGHDYATYLHGKFERTLRAVLNIVSANAVDNTRPEAINIVANESGEIASCDYKEPDYTPLPDTPALEAALNHELRRQMLLEQSTRCR